MKLPDKKEAMGATETIVRYIEQCGPELREGLRNTPDRVIQSYDEIFSGYSDDASEILDSTFNAEGYDGIVMLRDMEFHSKLARLLDMHSKRLQNQERITQSVADDIVENLRPLGCAVILEAQHGCMKCRGVRKQNSIMTTSAMRGVFFDKQEARTEVLQLIRSGNLQG